MTLSNNHDDEKELEILINAEKINQLAQSSYDSIENEENGILRKLGYSISEIEKIVSLDSSVNDIKKELEEASDIIRDASISIRRYYENIEDNPERIIEIQSRIEILDNLKTKHGYAPEEKMIVGTSFGAVGSLFVAQKESKNNTLSVNRFIAISPPVELKYALLQIDNW